MRAGRLILIIAVSVLPLTVSAQQKEIFMPAGTFSVGIQAAYAGLNSDNSDILLLLDQVNAKGSAFYAAPQAEFSYRDNRTLGVRMNYCSASLSADQIGAGMRRIGGAVFHRNYFALDRKNRLAAFAEFSASLTGGRTQFGNENEYSSSLRARLSFSPGLTYFVMNNVSVSLSIGLAGLSYNSVKCYSDGVETGYRHKFGADFGLDLLGSGFGISFWF